MLFRHIQADWVVQTTNAESVAPPFRRICRSYVLPNLSLDLWSLATERTQEFPPLKKSVTSMFLTNSRLLMLPNSEIRQNQRVTTLLHLRRCEDFPNCHESRSNHYLVNNAMEKVYLYASHLLPALR